MELIIFLIFLVAFIDSIIIITIKSYNQLVKYRNALNKNYADISAELTFRMELFNEYIPIISEYIDKQTIDELNSILLQYKIKVAIVDIADIYYKLNNMLEDINVKLKEKGFAAPEWDKAFEDSKNRVEAIRLLYDDNVLKMNNLVDMAPTNIVAKVFGFVKWPYFRNK